MRLRHRTLWEGELGMELLISIAVGVIVGSGAYMMMKREILRVILGSLLLSYGINLALFMSGGVKTGGRLCWAKMGRLSDLSPIRWLRR